MDWKNFILNTKTDGKLYVSMMNEESTSEKWGVVKIVNGFPFVLYILDDQGLQDLLDDSNSIEKYENK